MGNVLRAYSLAFAGLLAFATSLGLGSLAAHADTLEWALVQAYQNNPSLNAQRASLRATDENVPQALSGYRPKLSLTADRRLQVPELDVGISARRRACDEPIRAELLFAHDRRQRHLHPVQRLPDRQSDPSGGKPGDAARETLRVTEQQVLLDAATAYMNLLRDPAILDLNRRNVEVLTEQLKQTRDRFNVGEVTRTDVAQAESRLAAGRSPLLGAQSNYVTSQANYRRVIGVDPGRLAAGTPVDRLSPNMLARAIVEGQQQSPSVLAAMYGVDIAELAVKISEGALYPNLAVTGSVARAEAGLRGDPADAASAVAQLTVPIYQGGGEYSTIRQSKETVGQQRLNLDVNRDQARATVVQSWGQLDAAKAQIEATTAQVNASEIALNGVREEARVGQRTTLDVLNAQQELVNARVALVTAQHDRVVASYTLLAAVGGLSMPQARTQRPDLRSAGALSANARCVGRRAKSRRQIINKRRSVLPAVTSRLMFVTDLGLPSTFAMTYLR